MSTLSVILSTLSAITILIYFGNNFVKFNISREAWLIITIITCVIFTVNYLRELITNKKEE